LHLGLISEAKRKSLPAIAQVGLDNAQSLHHFLTTSPWQSHAIQQQRLRLILNIRQREIVLVIDHGRPERGITLIT